MPATVADPAQSLDSKKFSPAAIAHHTVYEKTSNLQQSHVCQWETQPYLVGPLSRLVGKLLFEPSLSTNVLPLTKAAYRPNSAISLTQTFDRTFYLMFVTIGILRYEKQKTGTGEQSCLLCPFSPLTKRHLSRETRSTKLVAVCGRIANHDCQAVAGALTCPLMTRFG